MDAAWGAWIDGSLRQLNDRHLTRVLRPLVPTQSAVQASIHPEQLDAWLDGGPAPSGAHTLFGDVLSNAAATAAAAAAAAALAAAQAQAQAQQEQEQQQAGGQQLRPLRLFGLNDYMGLSTHPDVRAAAAAAALSGGMGPRSSALVCGFTNEHRLLELEIARLKGTEDCLLFPTGYAANMAVLTVLAATSSGGSAGSGAGASSSDSSGSRGSSLVAEYRQQQQQQQQQPEVVIFSDELNHASIIDGTRLAARGGGGGGSGSGSGVTGGGGGAGGVVLEVYRHGDLAHLEQLLRRYSGAGRKLVVTDGLFSMDGDFADLRGLARLRSRYGFLLVVDDAHATLVAGPHGGGSAEMQRVPPSSVDVTVGTLSKAFGCLGGFAAVNAQLRSLLLNRGRNVIFSTSLPLPVVAAARAALRVSQRESWRRRHLLALVSRLSSRLGVPAHSPVIPLVVGPEAETMAAARQLLAAGFHVGAIRPPTVPAGTCRLRVSLSAAHTFADIDDLADAILGCRLRFAAPLAHLLLPPPWSREWLTAQDAADTAAAAGPGGAGRLAAMLPRARM